MLTVGIASLLFVSSGRVLPMQDQPLLVKPYALVKHEPIDEMSGIAKSRRYEDVYWVHNDSGDSARIFAIRGNGSIVNPPRYNRKEDAGKQEKTPKFEGIEIARAENFDWEDIAVDGDKLYISDMGNNGNARRDLGIYLVIEPNPFEVDRTRAVTFYPIAYPDQTEFPPKGERNFDCEAIFVLRGKVHLITKSRLDTMAPGQKAALYRLDNPQPGRVNILKKLDTIDRLGGWVTAADVSPDGKTLAVLVQAPQQVIWLFDTGSGDKIFSRVKRKIPFLGGQQCEAITWQDNQTLVFSNEQRELFRFDLGKRVNP